MAGILVPGALSVGPRDRASPDALFVESNPIPLKAGLQMMGLGGDFVRLPLVPAAEATRARIKAALAHAGIKY